MGSMPVPYLALFGSNPWLCFGSKKGYFKILLWPVFRAVGVVPMPLFTLRETLHFVAYRLYWVRLTIN